MKKVRLATDVIVDKYLTLPMLMELVVVNETEADFIVKLGSDTIPISKFECNIVKV